VAETPDELLARAVTAGLASVEAASRLTALFYEARFSTHPLGRGERDAAERALTEIAAGLAEPPAGRRASFRPGEYDATAGTGASGGTGGAGPGDRTGERG
jgi:hypothetical protein